MSLDSDETHVDPSLVTQLLQEIGELQLIMVAVSTTDTNFGELSLQDSDFGDNTEDRYKMLYLEVFVQIERLQERGINVKNPNNFKTTSDWWLYCKGHLPTYQSRRQFVGELYRDLRNGFIDALNRQSAEQTSADQFARDLTRRFSNVENQDVSIVAPPSAIKDSIAMFRRDHPDPKKTAFIMMRFSSTPFHTEITNAIKQTLAIHHITGLRADDRQYHDDLFPNIETYIYGCTFGIAVFERIEQDDFNPNVSLEVGYMLGLKKPVCLLKERSLRIMQADLTGKLYNNFDLRDIQSSIRQELTKWMNDKRLDTSVS